MRIFAVKDDTFPPDQILAYLIYYENAKAFYIELPDDADPWDTPPILSSFVRRGEHSVNSYWSRLWVQQRIIPPDRQNLGAILRDNGLKEYDEFEFLLLAMGRCAQDDCYLEEIPSDTLPPLLLSRWKTKVEDVIPLDAPRLLVFFRSGETGIVDVSAIAETVPPCRPYCMTQDRFDRVEVQPDGYGVQWSEQAALSDALLHSHMQPVPLSLRDFRRFVQQRVISTAEACSLLSCSRQNIDDLIRRKKLNPIRSDARNKLFLKTEVLQRRKNND